MSLLLLFVPVVVVFAVFQFGKRIFPWLDNLEPLAKQAVVICAAVGASLLYAKLGLPMPEEIKTLQTAAVVGFIQGLAAVGVHGVKSAANGQ